MIQQPSPSGQNVTKVCVHLQRVSRSHGTSAKWLNCGKGDVHPFMAYGIILDRWNNTCRKPWSHVPRASWNCLLRVNFTRRHNCQYKYWHKQRVLRSIHTCDFLHIIKHLRFISEKFYNWVQYPFSRKTIAGGSKIRKYKRAFKPIHNNQKNKKTIVLNHALHSVDIDLALKPLSLSLRVNEHFHRCVQ